MARQLEEGQSIDADLAAAISGAPRSRGAVRNDVREKREARKRRDKFFVSPSEIPKGYAAEWKRKSCLGKQEEPDYQMDLHDAGWRYASPKQFPSLVPEGSDAKIIERGGCVLMIRPLHMKKESLRLDHEEATGQVRDKLTEIGMTGQGEAPRKAFNFNREYDRPAGRRMVPENDGSDAPEVGHEGGDGRPGEEV